MPHSALQCKHTYYLMRQVHQVRAPLHAGNAATSNPSAESRASFEDVKLASKRNKDNRCVLLCKR